LDLARVLGAVGRSAVRDGVPVNRQLRRSLWALAVVMIVWTMCPWSAAPAKADTAAPAMPTEAYPGPAPDGMCTPALYLVDCTDEAAAFLWNIKDPAFWHLAFASAQDAVEWFVHGLPPGLHMEDGEYGCTYWDSSPGLYDEDHLPDGKAFWGPSSYAGCVQAVRAKALQLSRIKDFDDAIALGYDTLCADNSNPLLYGFPESICDVLPGGGEDPSAFINFEPTATAYSGNVTFVPRIGGYSDMYITTAPWALDFIVRPVEGRTPVNEWIELYRGQYEPQPWRYYTAVQFKVNADEGGTPESVQFRICGKLDAEWDDCLSARATTPVSGWGDSVAYGIWHGESDDVGSLIAGPTGVSEGVGGLNWYAHQLFAKTDRENIIGDADEADAARVEIYPGGGDFEVPTWSQFQAKFDVFTGDEAPLGDFAEVPLAPEFPTVPEELPVPTTVPVTVPDPHEDVDPGAEEAGLFDILGNRIGGFFDNLASGIGGAFNWLGDIFGTWIRWLANALRGMFGSVLDALHVLGDALVWMLRQVINALGAGLGLVTDAVGDVAGAVGSLPGLIGDQLYELFIPTAGFDLDALSASCGESFPCSWVQAGIDGANELPDVIGSTASCSTPSFGWESGAIPDHDTAFSIALPAPSGCAGGNGAADGEAGDLWGYRGVIRAFFSVLLWSSVIAKMLATVPWSKGEDMPLEVAD
jgi:hypothetical protein